jgi:Cu-Zn family superoxide dismutase
VWVVYLTQHGHRTYIEGCITGLTPGLHGFHNEYGDLTDGCTSACAHYNPFHQVHGGPSDRVRHVGDVGNIEAVATFGFWDPVIRLKGPYSVIGRACGSGRFGARP